MIRSLTSCQPVSMLSLWLCLLTLTLAGCGTQVGLPGSEPVSAVQESYKATVNDLLTEAQASQSPRKESLLLEVARVLHEAGQLTQARNLLTSLDPDQLQDRQFLDYSLIFSGVALDDDAYFLAQDILTNERLIQQWQNLEREQQITLRMRRADLFMLLGETETSIAERMQLNSLLAPTSSQRESNLDNLWQSLMTIPVQRLLQLTQAAPSVELRGWSELALIGKNNQSNLEKQLQQVNEWQSRWPQHPASSRLPKDLQLLQRLVAERPRQVALLLPQQGRAAKAGIAVRDGFMAAFYAARAQQGQVPVVRSYDTSAEDILAVYQRAVEDGAQLVIGPLDKASVTRLNSLEQLPVPVLAVNYIDNHIDSGSEFTAGLYQFGLAIEDEAEQTAQRAWLEGHRYAMILSNSESWGERSAEVFTAAWQSLGGHVVEHSRFVENDNFAALIGTALQIEQSQERYKALRGVLGKAPEFEPRRRRDVDMLFLVARPQEARQINPTLAFHYAAELAVYATSHVYGGSDDEARDRDLNDIRFSTLPWYFERDNPEKRAIDRHAKPAASYERLYALGVDAFYIHPRLPQLQQSEKTRFYGVTGALKMKSNRRIEREQVWAQIRNGSAVQLPALVTGE